MISRQSNSPRQFAMRRSLLVAATLATLISCCLRYTQLAWADQVYQAAQDETSRQISQLMAANQQQHNIPGHYEFEIAPKMEPPSVRKPPYHKSLQLCPGSDPFADISPRDTLCGDLNQGVVPINPLGQNVMDQVYPFEVIKNKTLQFLARALPELKQEYDTIPKVARYLPTNQLLNPTHPSSMLTHDHLHHLNQRFALANGFAADATELQAAPYLRRRRKRWASPSASVAQSQHQHQYHHYYHLAHHSTPLDGATVAELSPNATLVVSSAHSTGRIHERPHGLSTVSASTRNNESQSSVHNGDSSSSGQFTTSATHSSTPLAVITKDGYKQIQAATGQAGGSGVQQAAGPTTGKPTTNAQNQQQPPQRVHSPASNYYSWAPNVVQQTSPGYSVITPTASAVPTSSSMAAQTQNSQELVANKSRPVQPATGATISQPTAASASSRNGNGNQVGGTNISGNNGERQQQALAPATVLQQTGATNPNHAAGRMAAATASSSPNGNADSPKSGHTSAPIDETVSGQGRSASESSQGTQISNSVAPSSGQIASGPKQTESAPKRKLACSDSSNGFTSAICHAASALIEPTDQQPGWLRLVKQFTNAYSSTSSSASDGIASAGGPIWSLLSSASQAIGEPANSKSGAGNSLSQTRANLINMITSYLSGNSAKDSSTTGSQNKEHSALSTNSLVNSMARLALVGWASNAIGSLMEHFVPSTFSSMNAQDQFARRKKPFDPQETFVDTPASVAATLSAANMKQPGTANGLPGKQPPTPCPSVEEYISPTFARNYQGSWKYVVQIPKEGYFTQTIQKTSCVRHRCEFTEGVCHASPRWVSLLVAEIYYPNTIFSQGTSVADNVQAAAYNQLATSSSNSNIQQVAMNQQQQQQQQQQQHQIPQQQQQQHLKATQDPLQMTDSLNTYNHNLNNAFISAANELGLDPTNVASMQHLANAYHYQLLQRNGMLPAGQQQQFAEARSSAAYAEPNVRPQLASSATPISHHQYSVSNSNTNNNNLNQGLSQNEYITALAAATLQQNPHMTINDLINSLQLQHMRKKREIGQTQAHPRNTQQQYNTNPQLTAAQPRSSVEQVGSINELGSLQQQFPSSVGQQSQLQQFTKQQQQMANIQAQNQFAASSNQSPQTVAATNQASSAGDTVGASPVNSGTDTANQMECDGHDKIGCYVVRVYYDWFLVNGSCKCWKTSSGQSSASTSGGGNSFLRRIFTG